ncbi:GH92 family glycosyl hydrolase [Niabella aurantiaca]|uniref:GH92 family glycosyl hydrolase n=1 Tax=Niabella aurantiaca TaxID=379900 RepID=UPI00146E37B7|nr:GH92 family glycosyl hydrolase [Niabella aurantiaca]
MVCWLAALCMHAGAQQKQPIDYVDPFIGTSNSRWMLFPGATMPNGMVKLSPDNQRSVWQGGYEYSIGSIHGFSHVHGWTMAGLLTMPANGDLALTPGLPDDPFKGAGAGYHSRFRHEDEKASPGYYSVFLLDPQVKAELTATERTGVQRYSFPADSSNRVMIQLNLPSEYGIELKDAQIVKVSDSEVAGYARTVAAGFNDYCLYFVMQFSKPFRSFNGFTGRGVQTGDTVTAQDGIGAYVSFPMARPGQVLLRTGISFVSAAQARLNLQEELKDFGWDFDAIAAHSRSVWSRLLSTIIVAGGSEENKTKFYTNFYRCFTAKMIMSDVNGKYRDACEQVQQLPRGRKVMIGGDAYWNSFWNLNLLWSLSTPDLVEQLVDTQLELFEKTGWLSKGPAGIEYSGIMEGSHQMALMTSAYRKGIVTKNAKTAYAAMKKHVTVEPQPLCGGSPGNPQISVYAAKGYMPVEKGVASKTLDYAYDDWCVAQMAQLLHKEKDYQFFLNRSASWKHAFDTTLGYVVPRKADGSFITGFDRFSVNHFIEGNSWQYSFYVPHDVPGLIRLMGRERFLNRLQEGFKKSEFHRFAAHALDRTQGQSAEYYINHGNEVNMQAAYLFNYAGRPQLTQYYTRKILDTFYDASPYVGWNGDEDEGQMGAWFVISALGLFEMNGGTAADQRVDLTSPLFREARIRLNNAYYKGKEFVIRVHNYSPEHIYIRSAALNGKTLKGNYIRFNDIVNGGLLELHMTATPDPQP